MSHNPSPRRLPVYWWTLSFQAGAINAGGLLSCGRGVSYVTGFGTNFATEAAFGQWQIALSLLSVPVFFLLGAILTTYVLEHPRMQTRAHYRGYSWILGLISLLCIAVSLLGWKYFFGDFSASLNMRQHYMLLIMLSLTCGLQNALFSDRAGTLIRSTHMTGPVTDLGIGLGRLLLLGMRLRHRRKEPEVRKEIQFTIFRAGAVGMFIGGAFLGSLFFLKYEYLGFLLPSFTACVLFFDSLKVQTRLFFA